MVVLDMACTNEMRRHRRHDDDARAGIVADHAASVGAIATGVNRPLANPDEGRRPKCRQAN
jgi:hypothetical protein